MGGLSSTRFVQRLFDDKIVVCRGLLVWLAGICFLFVWLGTQSIPFFHVGPSPHTWVMGAVIDTWAKWCCVTVLTFFNTLCTEYVYDCLHPWLMTTVVDHKTIDVAYSKADLVYISVVSSVYRVVIQVVMIYVMLSQIDFLFVRVAADLMVTVVATNYFLRDKQCLDVPSVPSQKDEVITVVFPPYETCTHLIEKTHICDPCPLRRPR